MELGLWVERGDASAVLSGTSCQMEPWGKERVRHIMLLFSSAVPKHHWQPAVFKTPCHLPAAAARSTTEQWPRAWP